MTKQQTWEYRIIRRKEHGGAKYALCMVRLDEHRRAFIPNVAIVSGTFEEVMNTIDSIAKAPSKSIIDEDDCGVKSANS